MSQDSQVTITYTPTVTTAIKHKVVSTSHNRGGGRKRITCLPTSNEPIQSPESKRCSIQNTKRTFKGIVHANFSHNFCMLTLTFNSKCNFNIKDFYTCREKFHNFWRSLQRSKKFKHVDLRYIGAIEFQRNGNIHFHVLCRIPKEFRKLLKSKWKYGNLHYEQSHGSALDAPKIANYLTKGIHDDRLPFGKKRFLGGGGLDRPVVLKFKGHKIIDFLLQRNGKILSEYKSSYGFTFIALLTDATIDELERFAEAENEDVELALLEKLESIQYVNEGGPDYVYA